ncbi:MAG: starch synthase, partial [Oscillospiraceae bacterium]
KQGNGFTFKTYNAHDMLWAINRSVDLYYNHKTDWRNLVDRAMKADHSWNSSALEYINMYKGLLAE